MPPLEQERVLLSVPQRPFWERRVACYSNFHFSMQTKYAFDRRDAVEKVPKELVFYEPAHTTRERSWNTQTQYAFVLSPHGNGLDCHRTWEALVLGCIPVVKTSPLDPLYAGLPVLIVQDWSRVTKTLLTETIAQFKNKTFQMEKLKLAHWVNQIRNA
jgi:hypothetical protein